MPVHCKLLANQQIEAHLQSELTCLLSLQLKAHVVIQNFLFLLKITLSLLKIISRLSNSLIELHEEESDSLHLPAIMQIDN